jgi:PAS domain S-box-containing protein
MKPGLRQQKSQGNKADRPKRVGPMPVLMSADSGPVAEEEARRASLLYSRLVNSVDCIVWEADAKTFQFSFVSPQAKRILGYAPEQWFSPGFWTQHVHPDDVEWCTKFCMQATEEGRDHEFEYRMVAADGRTVWLHDVVSVQVGPEGSKQLTGVMIDITSRKVAEEARKESEEPFRLVFERSAAGIVIGDTSGRIIRANQRFCELIGFSQDELQGRTAVEITHPADREATQAYLEKVKTGRTGTFELEKRYVRRDGQVVWGRISVVFVFPDNRPPYSICVVQDITGRKRAESLVALQNQTLEMIAQGMPLKETLTTLVREIELQSTGIVASIVLLDEDGLHVRHGAAPSLPEGYIKAIDGAPIGPRAGSCGTAMFRREPVTVIDVMQDPLWEDYRDLAAAYDVRACWSTPVLSTDKKVLGSFAIYYPESRGPSPVEMRLVEVATQLASIAIERQRAEELRRESEERFRTIFENAGLGTSVVDRHGHPVECNFAIQKMLGYTETELRNMPFTEFTHPDDIDLDWKLYRELAAGKRDKYEIEKRYIKKNGEVMWAHLTVSLIRNNDGTPAEYTVGMVEDITERKRSEELLRNSEERFRTIFENAGVGAALVDWEGHPVKCNPALQRMLGFTESELRSMAFTEFTHPEDKDLDWKLYSELVAGKRDKYEIEKRYIKKDGQLMWGQLTVSRVNNESGPPAKYMVGMVVDITERKRTEEALKKSEEKFSKAFRQSPMSITLSTAKDHRYIEVNETFERMTGWSRDEVIGRTRFDIGLWENPVDGVELVRRVWAEGLVRDVEVSLRRRDGTVLVALGTAEVIELNGEPFVISGFADITDRKRAELELRVAHGQLTKELAERSRAEAEIVRLSERLITAQEEERTRIAREHTMTSASKSPGLASCSAISSVWFRQISARLVNRPTGLTTSC